MPFFYAIPTNLAHRPERRARAAVGGPYYISARTPNKSIMLKRNPNYKGPRPHNVDKIEYNVGNSLDAIELRVEPGATDYAAGGIPPASYAEARPEVRRQQGPVLGQAAARRHLLAMNHDRPLFKGNARAREGRQLRDRPQGDAQPGWLPRRQAHRPDPAPGHRRASVTRHLPAQGRRTSPSRRSGSRSPVAAGNGRLLHLEHVRRVRGRRRSSSST